MASPAGPGISCQVVPETSTRSSEGKALNSIHGVGWDDADGAAVDEVDDGVQLPEVLAGGFHLHPQHPAIPSLCARGPTQSPEKEPLLYLQESRSRKRARALGDGGVP